jgi:molybdenum cofactor biosynthesis enzyme MoaA
VWVGEKIKKIRAKILKADFSLGCQTCYESFAVKNFKVVDTLLYEKYTKEKDQPVILDFKTDTGCNLQCIMCSEYSSSAIRNDKNLLNNESVYNDSFITQLEPWIPKAQEFRFSGGEPFLSTFYLNLWQKIVELNPDALIYVQTNGTILNRKIKDILEAGRFSINVSVDAREPSLYKSIRVGANPELVWANIDYFSEYSKSRNLDFGITTCLLKQNWQEIPNILRFANQKNALLWVSPVILPFKDALWLNTAESLQQIYNELSAQTFAKNTEIAKRNKIVYEGMLVTIEHWMQDAILRENNAELWIDKNACFEKLLHFFLPYAKNGFEKENITLKLKQVFEVIKGESMLNPVVFLQKAQRPEIEIPLLINMDVNSLEANVKAFIKK